MQTQPVRVILALGSLVIIGALVLFGLNAYRQQSSSGFKEKKLSSMRLSFSYPKSWHVTADDESRKAAYFALNAPDGFQLGFTVSDISFFKNDDLDAVNRTGTRIAEVLGSNKVGKSLVYADTGMYPFHSIAVTTKPLQVDDTLFTGDESDALTNPAVKGLGLSINGGFPQGFKTLEEFDSQASTKDVKRILQSLKYY